MTDIKVPLPSFGKDVTVSVPDGDDMATAFNAASQFIKTLAANNQIADMERGINPKGATHEIVADGHGGYELRRMRFGIAYHEARPVSDPLVLDELAGRVRQVGGHDGQSPS